MCDKTEYFSVMVIGWPWLIGEAMSTTTILVYL